MRHVLPVLPVLSVLPVLACAAPVPPELFHCADPHLEVTVWAASPLLRNPTNIDIDQHGRIWVAEGVNYRKHFDREPAGDRIMVLEDTDGDGKADKSWPFVQEPFLRAPLGVAVIGNKVVVSMAPDLVVYTDKDGDAVFDATKGDTREVLLTGFNGRNHDHSLHSVTVGPDGKWYFSAGNCGAKFTDKSGKTFRIAAKQNVSWWPKDPERPDFDPNEIAGQKSDDGRVYVGGFIARMDPDGANVEILAHNLRNSFENCVTSYGDIFASDNDDQPACRVFWVLEGGHYGFASADGQRTWQADRRPGQSIQTATWRQEDPGVAPAGDVYGGGAPTGCVFYENGALDDVYENGGAKLPLIPDQNAKSDGSAAASPHLDKAPRHEGTLLVCESARNTIFGYQPQPAGAGWKLERFDFLTTNKAGEFAGTDFKGGNKGIKADDTKTLFRPSDIAVGPDGALYISDWHDPRTGGHADMDDALEGTIYRVAPKGFKSVVPKVDPATVEGALAALKSPAVHVRALGAERLRNPGPKRQRNVPAEMSRPLKSHLHGADPTMAARSAWLLASHTGVGSAFTSMAKKLERGNAFAMRLLGRYHADSDSILQVIGEDPFAWIVEIQITRSAHTLRLPADFLDMPGVALAYAQAALSRNAAYSYYAEALFQIGDPDPLKWSAKFAALAFQLHPPQSIPAFQTRALSPALPLQARLEALTAIGFNDTKEAAEAMLEVAVKLTPAPAAPAPGGEEKKPGKGILHPADGGRSVAGGPPAGENLVPGGAHEAVPGSAVTKWPTDEGFSATDKGLFVANKGWSVTEEGSFVANKGLSVTDKGSFVANKGLSVTDQGWSVANKGLSVTEEGSFVANKGLSVTDEGSFVASKGLSVTEEGSLVANQSPSGGEKAGAMAAAGPSEADRVRETALWWLLNRKDSTWKAHGLNAALKKRGLYDAEKVTLLPAPLPEPVAAPFSTADAAKLTGDAKRGEAVSAKCFLCHKIGDEGVDYGPDLSTFGRTQTTEALLRSMIEPDADLAHGFAGTRVETGDGIIIEGLLLSESDPLVIRSAGGLTQMVPAARVKSRTGLTRSLMMSAAQLGLTAQEAADLAAYLRGR